MESQILKTANDVLFNDYEVLDEIRRDTVFRWLKAMQRSSGDNVVLQVLNYEGIQPRPQKVVQKIATSIKMINMVADKRIIVPLIIENSTDTVYPLAIVFSDDICSLPSLPREDPFAEHWPIWRKAAEILHVLHSRKSQELCIGKLSPWTFAINGTDVVLRQFGYAPLVDMAISEVLNECEFLAPEIRKGYGINICTDIYAFAGLLGLLFPETKRTKWYRKATYEDGKQRFSQIREMIKAIDSELAPPTLRKTEHYTLDHEEDKKLRESNTGQLVSIDENKLPVEVEDTNSEEDEPPPPIIDHSLLHIVRDLNPTVVFIIIGLTVALAAVVSWILMQVLSQQL